MRKPGLIIFAFASFFAVGAVWGQSLGEQLNQLVTQLRANPNDTALRERIIKLAQEIKPSPGLPEEAARRMARGTAAFQDAKSATDYQISAREFDAATNAAPWLADAYFNLGMAQDKAGDYSAAIRSLKLAVLADPQSRETKSLLYQVEFRLEQANSPEVQAARRTQQQAAVKRSLGGAKFARQYSNEAGVFESSFEIRNSDVIGRTTLLSVINPARLGTLTHPGQFAEFGRYRLDGLQFVDENDVVRYSGTISPDGTTLTYELYEKPFKRSRQLGIYHRK